MTGNTYILVKPIISEKSLSHTTNGFYKFVVEPTAKKHDIKKAIEGNFKVNVIAVRTMFKKGAIIRTGRRRLKKISKKEKIAIVQIKPDQKIDLFEVTK